MPSSPWIPYFFFLYMFISSWIMMMNYDKIKSFSSSMRTCNGFISLSIAIFAFVGSAMLYNIDNRDSDYYENIKDLY